MQVCMHNSNAHSSPGTELPVQLVGQLPPPPTCPFATADLTRPVSTAPTDAPTRRHSIYSGEHLDWRGNGNAELRYKNPTRTYQPAFEYSYLTQVDGNWPKPLRACKQTNETLITHWHQLRLLAVASQRRLKRQDVPYAIWNRPGMSTKYQLAWGRMVWVLLASSM